MSNIQDSKQSEISKALAQELAEKLTNNPPFKCTLSFTGDFDQDSAGQIKNHMLIQGFLLRENYPWLNLDSLHQIVIHHDYEQGLLEATGGLRQAPKPTIEAGGKSLAMVFRVGDSVKLVLHEVVAQGFLSEDEAHRDFATNTFLHELCHAHDLSFKTALQKKHPDKVGLIGFGAFFLPMAESLWDEYFANKYSFGEWSDIYEYTNFVYDSLPKIRDEIWEAIRAYRNDSNLEALRVLAESKVRFIAQCFGYAMGTLAAIEKSVDEHAPNLAKRLEEYGVRKIWDDYFFLLNELDENRSNWESVLELECLVEPSVALMGSFGLDYRSHGDGAYIDVPFTPETIPFI